MITASTTLNSSLLTAYNRSGQSVSLFRSEPVQRVVVTPATNTGEDQVPADSVSLSPQGLEQSRKQQEGSSSSQEESGNASSLPSQESDQPTTSVEMTPEEEKMVQQLKQRDQEVKAHEMAHLAVAGQYARGGASYTYQQGPDGRRYAIGGEVPIDLSAEKTPEETIDKMRAIKRAATAPAEPSSADRSVAASATAMENSARQELQAEETEAARPQSDTEDEANKAFEFAATTDESAKTRQTARSINVVA